MRAFTLIEILIVLAVSSVVSLVLISLLISGNNLFLQQSTKVFQGLSLTASSDQITAAIKQSSQIVASYPLVSPQYITSSSVLVLSIPSVDSSGQIIDQKLDYIVFSADLQKSVILRKLVFPDPSSFRKNENRVLATNLSFIKFVFLDSNNTVVSPTTASKVSFTILLSEKAGNNNRISSVSGQVNLRNI